MVVGLNPTRPTSFSFMKHLQFWHDFIKLRWQRARGEVLRDSIKDFHTPNFNYICLQRTPGLTIRLYILKPNTRSVLGEINIHNHLYDTQLYVLRGVLTNTTYVIDEAAGEPMHAHLLRSALHPENVEREIKLEYIGVRPLAVSNIQLLGAGDTYLMPHTDIHSVWSAPTMYLAYLLVEHATVKDRSTIFTRERLGDRLPTPGAYNKYTEEEIEMLLTELLGKIEV